MRSSLIFVFSLFFGAFGNRIYEELIGRSPYTRRTLDDYLKGMQELGKINRQLYDIPEDNPDNYDFQTRSEEVDSNKPWMTPYLFEGDMILTQAQLRDTINFAKQQLAEKMGITKKAKRTLTSNTRLRWTTFPIPFSISPGVNRTAILAGIQLWQDNTCITFQENGQGRNNIQFFYGSGCYSNVGMTGGTQQTSIGLGCDYPAIVAHELGHCLGYYHEQARFDRDSYVQILTQNIQSGLESQFSKQSPQSMITFGVPYDYGSVMHYDPYSFSKNNQPTIQTLDLDYIDTIGQRTGLSFNDIKKINFAYCNATCSTQLNCQRGGYTDPKNCSQCRCPDGIGGTLCDQVLVTNDNCGTVALTATPTQQTLTKSGVANCNWVIQAPLGDHVIITIDNVRFNAYSPCETSYVEIRYGPDITDTGARFCDGVQNNQVTSQTNEVVVNYRSSSRSNSFSISFSSDLPCGTTTTTTASPTGCGALSVSASRLSAFDQKLNQVRTEAIKMLIGVVEDYQETHNQETEKKRSQFRSHLQELDSYLRGPRGAQFDSSSQSSEEDDFSRENKENVLEPKPTDFSENIIPSEEIVTQETPETTQLASEETESIPETTESVAETTQSISEVTALLRRRRSPSVLQNYFQLLDELEQEIRNL